MFGCGDWSVMNGAALGSSTTASQGSAALSVGMRCIGVPLFVRKAPWVLEQGVHSVLDSGGFVGVVVLESGWRT